MYPLGLHEGCQGHAMRCRNRNTNEGSRAQKRPDDVNTAGIMICGGMAIFMETKLPVM